MTVLTDVPIVCDGTAPPACCRPRPVMTQTERLWRLKAELETRRPYTCPHCGSGALLPTLAHDRRGTSICVACGREFTGVD